ncbi:hypothetical protein EV2_035476 [Malus domestica]
MVCDTFGCQPALGHPVVLRTPGSGRVTKQQASDSAYEANIIRYSDLTIVKEVKAKDYRESFEQIRGELGLERQAKVEMNQAIVALRKESKRVLTSEQNAWLRSRELF